MCTIIQFPKTLRAENFYKFIVRWTDGMTFAGRSVEECFRRQKDVFEPEYSMNEYLERFRYRLKVVTGIDYDYTDIAGLVDILVQEGFLEVIQRDDDGVDTKLS